MASEHPGWSTELLDSFEKLKFELRTLTDKVSSVQTESQTFRTLVQSDFKDLSKDFGKYRDELKTTQGTTGTLSTVVFSILGVAAFAILISTVLNFSAVMKLGGHGEQITELQTDVKSIQSEVASIGGKINEHSALLSTTSVQLSGIKDSMVATDANLQRASKELSAASKSVASISDRLVSIESLAKDLKVQVDGIGDTAALTQLVKATVVKVDDASVSLKAIGEHITQIEGDIDRIGKSVGTYSELVIAVALGKPNRTEEGGTLRFSIRLDERLRLDPGRIKRATARITSYPTSTPDDVGSIACTVNVESPTQLVITTFADEAAMKSLMAKLDRATIPAEVTLMLEHE